MDPPEHAVFDWQALSSGRLILAALLF